MDIIQKTQHYSRDGKKVGLQNRLGTQELPCSFVPGLLARMDGHIACPSRAGAIRDHWHVTHAHAHKYTHAHTY